MNQKNIFAHWKLLDDFSNSSTEQVDAFFKDVKLTEKGAYFNGRSSQISLENGSILTKDAFSFSADVWIDPDSGEGPGDIFSCYHPQVRRGVYLNIKDNLAGPFHASSRRQLHFGIDDRCDPKWSFLGQPGGNRYITSLAVHQGKLYASTFDDHNDHKGHIYRYINNGHWKDLGAPDNRNSVTSLISVAGELYCVTQNHDPHEGHSGYMEKSPNDEIGGDVYHYQEGSWVSLNTPYNNVKGTTLTLSTYKDQLIIKDSHFPDFYLYEDGKWKQYPTQNWAITTMIEINGELLIAPKKVPPQYIKDLHYPKQKGTTFMKYDFEKELLIPVGLGSKGKGYGLGIYRDELFIGNWPGGAIFKAKTGFNDWEPIGSCGLGPMENKLSGEVMCFSSYNGQLYIGTLPHADLYRYNGDFNWTKIPGEQRDTSLPVRRLWCMEEFQGKLICGTLPFGEVWAMEAGIDTSPECELPTGWNKITAVKDNDHLRLYLNGLLASTSSCFPTFMDIDAHSPLLIGAGPVRHFKGYMKNISLHSEALQG